MRETNRPLLLLHVLHLPPGRLVFPKFDKTTGQLRILSQLIGALHRIPRHVVACDEIPWRRPCGRLHYSKISGRKRRSRLASHHAEVWLHKRANWSNYHQLFCMDTLYLRTYDYVIICWATENYWNNYDILIHNVCGYEGWFMQRLDRADNVYTIIVTVCHCRECLVWSFFHFGFSLHKPQ